ncbi:MAG: hypothetical protein J6N76_03750, partial [Lachnospiraceae bacterium]|nr:hypothetical protein [Lachnospiraceae bacterium]
DSPKMLKIRAAVSKYLDLKEGDRSARATRSALDDVIKACDSYKFGKFEFFKKGAALERLKEVNALREQVINIKQTDEDIFKITNKEENFFSERKTKASKAGLGKKILAGIAGAFQVSFWNLAKLCNGNKDMIYSFDQYYTDNIERLDNVFQGKSISKEEQQKRYEAEQNMLEEDNYMYSTHIDYELHSDNESKRLSDEEVMSKNTAHEKIQREKRIYTNRRSDKIEERYISSWDEINELVKEEDAEINKLEKKDAHYDKYDYWSKFFYSVNDYKGISGADGEKLFGDEDTYIEQNKAIKKEVMKDFTNLKILYKDKDANIDKIIELQKRTSETKYFVKDFASYMRQYRPDDGEDFSNFYATEKELIELKAEFETQMENEAQDNVNKLKDFSTLIEGALESYKLNEMKPKDQQQDLWPSIAQTQNTIRYQANSVKRSLDRYQKYLDYLAEKDEEPKQLMKGFDPAKYEELTRQLHEFTLEYEKNHKRIM